MCSHRGMTVLRSQAFSASALADREGFAAAIRILESCLSGPDFSLDLVVQDLCSIPGLFEFIVSAMPSHGHKLASRVINAYPTNPALVEVSYTSTLLRRLSSSLFALPPDLFSPLTVRQIGQNKVYVENALPVLFSLYSAEFPAGVLANVTSPIYPEYDNEFSRSSVVQREQKKFRSRKKDGASAIDTMHFQKLGVEVPSNRAQASTMAHEISEDLEKILKFCLEQLFEPSIAQQFKCAYVSTINDTNLDPAGPPKADAVEVLEPETSPYPEFQHMQVALNFENANGFGEWRIIISTNATNRLRELANVDRKRCVIIVKKIKQLSKGHFDDENQKRLNGSSGVPIFEARVQQDLRLVYQVDVTPDLDGYVERQVIRIYAIRTHSPLNHVWDAIGQHLAGKGEEYIRRCIFRNQSMHHGGTVYLPASFPLESVENVTKLPLLVPSDTDMGELHSLLVLDKYITFSQGFLHSLIINKDVQHVFELKPNEHKIVECKTSCYVLGRSGTGKTTTMLFKMLGIERAWQMQMSYSDIPKPRQIFVTKSHALAENVEEYFTKLLESLVLGDCSLEDLKAQNASTSRPRVRIPTRFSLLEDNHFPLFVTFDKLARMIARDVLSSDNPEAQRDSKIFINPDEIEIEDSLVTFDIFARTYWPHFPQPLPKGLEPWLVFSEFMGVIKGSEKSLMCPGGCLDEATYCGLSPRSSPTFANHRQMLYMLFRAYCKLKREYRHHDVADRTHIILKALLGGTPFEGQRVDFLYVDEAQDNLLVDALLLRLICRNPEGLFWAGDTAQAISAGSSFKFADLKAFMYRIERDRSMHVIQDRSVIEPSAFQLEINYRSHGGIVNCARTVIDLILHFWPDAIDRLTREQGIVDGAKPVFFCGGDQEILQHERFNKAEQCILVRDKPALKKLQHDIGDEDGLIMTLYDSKGLEFDDVLLYNFFEDSPFDALCWSVLLNVLRGGVDGKDLAKVHVPSFEKNEGRFAGICTELKMLYVGITRAKKNLWIFDKSGMGEPIRMIWTFHDQIQNWTPGMPIPRLAVSSTDAISSTNASSSTNAEWESFGRNLLKHEKYLPAKRCFAKASLPRMVAICEALERRELARAKVGVEPQKAQQDAFLAAAKALHSATNAFATNDTPSANEKHRFYCNAAECYARGGDNRKAAAIYLSVEEYDLCARSFRRAGLFDETLEILHVHSQKISPDCSKELLTVCRLFYCSKRGRKRPRWPLFPSFEEEEKFLKEYDLDFSRVELLEFYEKYLEAAKIHLSENRPLDAIRDFLKEGSRDAIQRATKTLLDNLWNRCSFAVSPKKIAADQLVTQLLDFAREWPVSLVDPLDRHEISAFLAIARADFSGFDKLALGFINGNRNAPALLVLDYFFSRLASLESYSVHELSDLLAKFTSYISLLHSIISHTNPLSVSWIRRLLCIRNESGTTYGLGNGSLLYRLATGDHGGRFRSKQSVMALSKNDGVVVLRGYLGKYLCERVLAEDELCRKSPVFSQSLFVVTEWNYTNSPQEHAKPDELDLKQYNLRLGVHLQQINILQLMFSVNANPVRHSQAITLDWLGRLYGVPDPSPITDSDLSLMLRAHDDMHTMKSGVQDTLYNLRRDFLTTVLRLTSIFFAFDKSGAVSCIEKAYRNLPHDRIPQLIHPDGAYVAEDIVRFSDGAHHVCISAALEFLGHVAKSSQVANLFVFCACLEDVIGKISVLWQLSCLPPLDGLVLPRAWLSFSEEVSDKKEIPTALIENVLDCVRDLLTRLQSTAASKMPMDLETEVHLKTELTQSLRDTFTSRICRALCFLTYNVQDLRARRKIRHIVNAVQTTGPVQQVYIRHMEADDYEYLEAVIEYYIEAKEDLVQLLHKRGAQRASRLRLPRVKHVYFTDPSEIPFLLSLRLVPEPRSVPRPDAPASVPQDVPKIKKAGDDVHEVPEPQEPVSGMDEPAAIDKDGPAEQKTSAAKKIQAAYRKYRRRREILVATKKIQTAYRRYRRRREALTRAFGEGLKAQKNAIFAKCLKNVYASHWGRTPYRTLYLWVLPSLIVCLDKAMAAAHEFKKKTKNQFSKESHERLEELRKQMDNISALHKNGVALQKRVEPGAAMHQASHRDTAELKRAILDVKDFIDRLPVRVSGIENEFDFACKLVKVNKQHA